MNTKVLKKINKVLRPSQNVVDEKFKNSVEDLKKQGFIILENFIDEEEISMIQEFVNSKLEDLDFETPCIGQNLIDKTHHQNLIANNFLLTPNEALKEGIAFTKDQINSYQEVLEKFNPSTLKISVTDNYFIMKAILDKRLLAIVENYFGFMPILKEAYLRRNFSTQFKIMNHFWHRDKNSPFLLKAFLFITDCNESNGPHHYVSGSHNEQIFTKEKYYSDKEIEDNSIFQDRIHKSIVKAGTLILEDTRGLHKAGVPSAGFRDLAFAVFMPKFLNLRDFLNIDSKYYDIKEDALAKLSSSAKRYIDL